MSINELTASGKPRAVRSRSGGEILIDQLAIQGVTRIFGVPGESFLAALDALHGRGDIAFTTCRHEGGAAMMAEAWGKLTGRPGVCFVTRGPGGTNASAGVHVAQQDSTPMLLLIGQIARGHRYRDAFQEVDWRQFYGGMAKWVAEVDDAARLPELVRRAVATAMAGRPGPVVLVLPEDMLTDRVTVADASFVPGPCHPTADPETLGRIAAALRGARRPLVVLGGSLWDEAGRAAARDLAARLGAPVAVSFRRQDLIDNRDPLYAGHLGIAPDPALVALVREADLLLLLGPRLGEMTTSGYSLIDVPEPGQTIIHVHPDPEEPGRVYRADIALAASPGRVAAALAPLLEPRAVPDPAPNEAFRRFTAPVANPGPVQLARCIAALRERLPDDAIVCNGAGNYAGWVNRFFPYHGFRTQLAPTSGSMGYGVPAAIAAALCHPHRQVVAFAGDGCFQMTGQELATAVLAGARLLVIVVDNGMLGTIRMHQEREYPSRVSATTLANPDFAELARAYGLAGVRVESDTAFAGALDAALGAARPTLIHLVLDPEALTPARTLSQIRAAGEAARAR